MSRVGGAPSKGQSNWWKPLGLNGRPLVNTLWHRLLTLSALLESRASLNLELLQRALSLNIWPSLEHWANTQSNLWRNPRKPEATRKELRASNNTEQPSNNRRTSPEWRHATTRGVPSSHSDHFNLKAVPNKTFILLNRGVSISKVKLREFSIWWSTRVKSCDVEIAEQC